MMMMRLSSLVFLALLQLRQSNELFLFSVWQRAMPMRVFVNEEDKETLWKESWGDECEQLVVVIEGVEFCW
jgi:hypothetical protein